MNVFESTDASRNVKLGLRPLVQHTVRRPCGSLNAAAAASGGGGGGNIGNTEKKKKTVTVASGAVGAIARRHPKRGGGRGGGDNHNKRVDVEVVILDGADDEIGDADDASIVRERMTVKRMQTMANIAKRQHMRTEENLRGRITELSNRMKLDHKAMCEMEESNARSNKREVCVLTWII
jgi:hypothetical protein